MANLHGSYCGDIAFVLPAADGRRTAVGENGLVLRPAELALLLDGIDLAGARRQQRYQRPAASATAGRAVQ